MNCFYENFSAFLAFFRNFSAVGAFIRKNAIISWEFDAFIAFLRKL